MGAPHFDTLTHAANWYAVWLREAGLPLWANAGISPRTGAFEEALTSDGSAVGGSHRARVQARQVFVYATCADAGFGHGWRDVAQQGFGFFRAHFQRADGRFVVLVDEAGDILDEATCLYEQAFTLLAMAALSVRGGDGAKWRGEAERLLNALQGQRHPADGFRELGAHPFQSNALMHLLEAALAWEELGGGPTWAALANEIVALCLARFIDPDRGFLREFFDETWAPAAGDDGRWVEPGHQFEWSWLLERWGRARNDSAAQVAARTLYEHGLRGVDRTRGVAVNVLWDDLTVRDPVARLWPQTEYLKAALIFGDEIEAVAAANCLARYLDVPARGAWRDKMLPDGTFVEEPAPASSFYHIVVAVLELLKQV
jgi:mannose-1-phosphate guanylyltransferase/mannose-6-phosphate isomerase